MGVFLMLILAVVPQTKDDTNEVIVEVISRPSSAPTQQVQNKLSVVKDSTTFVKNENTNPKNLEMITAETEIGTDLIGRPPKNAQEKYLVSLRDQVRKYQKYPKPSLVFKEEGSVKVQITLDRKGSLTQVELIQESPFARLNEAAIKAVADAAPFSEFPDEVDYQTWKVTVPIQYNLTR